VIFILIGLGVLVVAWLLARSTGVPITTNVLGSDVGLESGELLDDPDLHLRGRPDYLLAERSSGLIYPVEVKPSRTSTTLLEADALQIGVYMLLTAARYGSAFAGYGVVRYRSAEFRVPLTPSLKAQCIAAARGVRAARKASIVHRDHASAAKCRACGVRSRCGESL
jgi:CRISPR-associated exonuclease Cas4